MTAAAATPRQVLIVDDDPLFCKQMDAAARVHHLQTLTFQGLEGLDHLNRDDLVAAVIDYDLGQQTTVTGIDIASFLSQRYPSLPLVLVSNAQSASFMSASIPTCIDCLVHKKSGVARIMEVALEFAHLRTGRRK